jgi:hypothetical protein
MAILDALRLVGKALHADVEEDPGSLSLSMVLAKRQAGLLQKRLRYRVRLETDDASQTVFFQEWLWEDDDAPGLDLASRIDEKEMAYRVSGAEAPGNVEQVAQLFQSRYGASFDFPQVRLRLRDACESEGYQLRHLIPL